MIFPVRLALLSTLALTFFANALPPEEALRKMKVPDGFTAKLVASEPEIRQPLSVSFDERGRMWVIQYLQYPTPAGLKPVKVDQYLRTTYDKVPEPPPRGPKGADKITICEDTDGDGRMDKFKDFLSGLNLCSGMALGYDGLFVAQPPYLLFYADKNHDDVPDGDPEVLLTGFGMEDAHAFANSLTFGPDGWLYGAQGSTVTANVRGIEFQQGIWRYHPRTHEFELFAEGGGNTWGVDFDSEGELFAGTNAYEKMLHHVQGAYYIKNFGKHGALHNPHAYGYFDHVPYSGYKGLHISTGGIVYHGGAFPPQFEGTYIFANVLDHAVYWANFQPRGSSFNASFGGALLKTDDELFRPIDCAIRPDGAIYVADWCDKRATHVDPLDTWDRSNGRIYKIESVAAEVTRLTSKKDQSLLTSAATNYSKLPSKRLVELLADKNDWVVRQARQTLAERRDSKIVPRLSEQIFKSKDHRIQLQSLWALYVSGGFNDAVAAKALLHTNESVRKWTVRFLGDAQKVSDKQRVQLAAMAKNESNPAVRAQLACSAKRLPGKDALPMIRELLMRNEDVEDPQIPLLLWWALERHAISSRTEMLEKFSSPALWKSTLVQKHILERLARRYADEGGDANFTACARLLEIGEQEDKLDPLLKGIDQALQGRVLDKPPVTLETWLAKGWATRASNDLFLRIALRLGFSDAQTAALKIINDPTIPESRREEIIGILGQSGKSEFMEPLLEILETSKSGSLRATALSALQRYSEPRVAESILSFYAGFNPDVRQRAAATMVSRPAWAELLVNAVETGKIPAKEISLEQARQMAALKNESLIQRVQKIWGRVQAESPAEKQNRINELKLVLKPSGAAGREVKGNLAEGKKLFQQTCAVCHKLFGEGNSIGPDLNGVDRKSTEFLLQNIVNPSGYIRTEYVSFEVETKDDQIVSGLIVESAPGAVTLLDRSNQRHTIAREQIRELKESQLSLMPDGLLDTLQPQQIIDLFSYLQKE